MGGKKASKHAKRKARKNRTTSSGTLTVDRDRKSGHYQGHMYSEVYKDGKVHVYTAWNDNDDDVGTEIPFEKWLRSYQR